MRTGTCSRERPRFSPCRPAAVPCVQARAHPSGSVQDVGLVRFHDPLEYLRIAPRRRQKPVTPAECRAHRKAACGLHRLAPATPRTTARSLWSGPTPLSASCRSPCTGSAATRDTARNRFARAMRKRRASSIPSSMRPSMPRTRLYRERLAPLARVSPRAAESHGNPCVHNPTSWFQALYHNAYNSRIEPKKMPFAAKFMHASDAWPRAGAVPAGIAEPYRRHPQTI